MSKNRDSIAPQIVDAASDWFVTMREPSTSAEERDSFAKWLRASPAHVTAYLEITKLWGDSARIDPGVDVNPTIDSAVGVVSLRAGTSVDRDFGREMDLRRRQSARRRRFRPRAIAAGMLIACLACAGVWWGIVLAPPTYVAGVGEQRVITLRDGSILRLNSHSKVAVSLSPKRRDVELIEGQALFQVAHDTSRPFIVHSGGADIRAVGTQFDVNRMRATTVVTVVEGRVRVDGAAEVGGTFLSAGEQATVDGAGVVALQPRERVAAATRWLHQEISFQGESLREVIEEFNHYSQIPIVLSDPTLGDLRINAVFHTTSPESLLRFVSRFENVEIERSNNEIRIYRKN